MKSILVYISLFLGFINYAQKPAYLIYNAKGKKVKYSKMIKSLLKTEIVLFGEIHNDPIAHWLTFELIKDIHEKKPVQIGMEMFERHQEELLNGYLKGSISEEAFLDNDGLWSNFTTDYFPIVNWAKNKGVTVFATNITRKYARQVFKEGINSLEMLTDKQKEGIAPLQIPFDGELPQYKKMLTMMGDHGGENLVKAQAIKDATMAHFILKQAKGDHLFFHVNGSFHSDFHEGIGWYLKNYKEDVRFKTISTVQQKNIKALEVEHIGKADFIICIPESMTKTY